MRIAMVSEHASPLAALGGEDAGGQNVHVAALAYALADRGHAVRVYTRRDDPSLPEVLRLRPAPDDEPATAGISGGAGAVGGTVDVVHVPAGPARVVPKDALAPWMPGFGDWLARHWTADGSAGPPAQAWPEVVHAHFWMSGLAALHARDLTGVPVVQTFHALGAVKRRHQGGRDTSPQDRVEREAELAARADAVLATCSDEVRELLALGAPADRLHVAPCGVDLGAFTSRGPRAPRTPGMRRVLSIGRLVERKGVDTLVQAVALLAAQGRTDVELVVAGGPAAAELDGDPEVRRLRALAAALGVDDRVRFVGRVGRADVPATIRSADVAACVPWYEPFGIVPLEAMACGVPVVVAAVGGMLDSVRDGVTGVHVPPRDPDAVAAALAALLDDEPRRRRLARAGVADMEQRFGWDRVAEATEAVYRQVAGRPTAEGTAGVTVDLTDAAQGAQARADAGQGPRERALA